MVSGVGASEMVDDHNHKKAAGEKTAHLQVVAGTVTDVIHFGVHAAAMCIVKKSNNHFPSGL